MARADTKEGCTQFKGCFDLDRDVITAVPEAQCIDNNICDPDQFEWRSVLKWQQGVWTPRFLVRALRDLLCSSFSKSGYSCVREHLHIIDASFACIFTRIVVVTLQNWVMSLLLIGT